MPAARRGLATALRLAGEEATIVELSWYGKGDVAAPLGEAFHSRRLAAGIEPSRQGCALTSLAMDDRRRLAAALALLNDPALDAPDRTPPSLRGFAGALAAIFASTPTGLSADPLSCGRGHPIGRRTVYAVEVSDQIMIAHSFAGSSLARHKNVHGATFVVRVAFLARRSTRTALSSTSARAHDVLKEALTPLNYRNLDDLPQFKGINTTTEFLTRHLFEHFAAAARAGKLGRDGRDSPRSA